MFLTDNARKVLEKRYYRKDENGNMLENWEAMLNRVANNIADGDAEQAKKFYDLMDSGYFLP